MAITTAVTNTAKSEFLQGVHQPTDVYKIALYDSSADLGAATPVYTVTGEVTGVGYTAGGAVLANFSVLSDAGTAIMSFRNPSWTASTITARGAVIYNSTRDNRALAVFDFGADKTSTNGSFLVVMPAQDATSGLIRIA